MFDLKPNTEPDCWYWKAKYLVLHGQLLSYRFRSILDLKATLKSLEASGVDESVKVDTAKHTRGLYK